LDEFELEFDEVLPATAGPAAQRAMKARVNGRIGQLRGSIEGADMLPLA
jgi:hypothetical protein